MSDGQMYTSLAEIYDLIYHWKDYPAEAERLHALLGGLGVADGSAVLEVACGTGTHLRLLRAWYAMSGVDLHEEMLAEARKKAPEVPLFQGDMRTFHVKQPVDALLCLFSSIGYLLTEADLRAAAARFAAALKPGGVLLVEPWMAPDGWDTGRPSLQTYQSPDLQLARGTVADRVGDIAIMDMNWLIVRRGQPVQHIIERHELWLCSRELLVSVFEDAGFDAWFDPNGLTTGRGLLVGRRRSDGSGTGIGIG